MDHCEEISIFARTKFAVFQIIITNNVQNIAEWQKSVLKHWSAEKTATFVQAYSANSNNSVQATAFGREY